MCSANGGRPLSHCLPAHLLRRKALFCLIWDAGTALRSMPCPYRSPPTSPGPPNPMVVPSSLHPFHNRTTELGQDTVTRRPPPKGRDAASEPPHSGQARRLRSEPPTHPHGNGTPPGDRKGSLRSQPMGREETRPVSAYSRFRRVGSSPSPSRAPTLGIHHPHAALQALGVLLAAPPTR